ncbi:hypothetical protein Pcinc_028322 [Petrolisthes cinctipes]|uniref:Uncharacterized protein n=1 Tax=Petrolisthes cinctipes TaxID=88211 RepID=A0AAE1K7F6_PETCI|nr:hypothetical protein Pcinc_028322 [Petrolisthes cinctipes]
MDTMETRVSTLEAKNLGVTDYIKQDETTKLSMMKRVSELEAKFTGVESGHVGMDKQTTTTMKINQQQAEEQEETVISEVYRRNTRVNNLVVHGVPEERSGMEEEGNEASMNYIQRMMEACGVRDSREKIEKVLRFGKTQQDKDRSSSEYVSKGSRISTSPPSLPHQPTLDLLHGRTSACLLSLLRLSTASYRAPNHFIPLISTLPATSNSHTTTTANEPNQPTPTRTMGPPPYPPTSPDNTPGPALVREGYTARSGRTVVRPRHLLVLSLRQHPLLQHLFS